EELLRPLRPSERSFAKPAAQMGRARRMRPPVFAGLLVSCWHVTSATALAPVPPPRIPPRPLPVATFGGEQITSFYCLRDPLDGSGRCAVEVLDPNAVDRHRTFYFPSMKEPTRVRIHESTIGEAGFGATVWYAGICLAAIVCERRDHFAGQHVLELGAGCGLSGLACKLAGAASVTLTDFEEPDDVARAKRMTVVPRSILSNLRYNVVLNTDTSSATDIAPSAAAADAACIDGGGEGVAAAAAAATKKIASTSGAWSASAASSADAADAASIHVRALDWHACAAEDYRPFATFDAILAADCIYEESDVAPLSAAIRAHLKPGGTAYMMSAEGRRGVEKLREEMEATGRGSGAEGEVVAARTMDVVGAGKARLAYFEWRRHEDGKKRLY
ncbi:unnamed protein product, partial [Phaeothamnion confervicola]